MLLTAHRRRRQRGRRSSIRDGRSNRDPPAQPMASVAGCRNAGSSPPRSRVASTAPNRGLSSTWPARCRRSAPPRRNRPGASRRPRRRRRFPPPEEHSSSSLPAAAGPHLLAGPSTTRRSVRIASTRDRFPNERPGDSGRVKRSCRPCRAGPLSRLIRVTHLPSLVGAAPQPAGDMLGAGGNEVSDPPAVCEFSSQTLRRDRRGAQVAPASARASDPPAPLIRNHTRSQCESGRHTG